MSWGFWLIIGIVIGCVLFFGIALSRPPPPRRPSISQPAPRGPVRRPASPVAGSLPLAIQFSITPRARA